MSSCGGLVGRDAELLRLTEWVNNLVAGAGCAALINGEPGIGKSVLANAAARIAGERGCRVYQSATDELGQALPLRPLLDALCVLESVGEPRLATIRCLLRGELAGGTDPVAAASEQMLTLVAELCSAAPTVLVVDDLQWADAATISVWKWLAQSAVRAPLLLIGTMRPVPQRDELCAVHRLIGASGVIHLGGLRNPDVVALIMGILGGKPSDDLMRLADGAAGNPLYLTELMGALVRADRSTVTEFGEVRLTGGPVPNSLSAAIADRLAFIPRKVREVLQAAALLGVEFRVSDLAVVLDRRIAELITALEEARAAGVLKEAGEHLSFRHPLIRDALYDEIPESVRTAWHRDAAQALADAGAPVSRVARQLLCMINMCSDGSLDESLLNWIVDAAPALVAQAPRAAIKLLRRATDRSSLTDLRGPVLACRLSDALYRVGECAEAERIAVGALSAVTDLDLLVDLHWTVTQCRALMGRSAESLEALDRSLSTPGLSLRQRARLLVLAARAHRDLGDVTIAGRVAMVALRTAEEARDRWAIGWSLHVLIIVSMMRGDAAAALPLFERALDVVGDDNRLTDLGLLVQINRAVALGDLDRCSDAIAAAERVRHLADQAGNLVRMAQAQSALGELMFEAGRWDDALAEVEVLPDEFKDPGATCCDRGIASLIAFHRGSTEAAQHHMSLAMPSAAKIGNRVVASLTLARSMDLEISGEPGEALTVLIANVGSQTEELDGMEDLLPEAARLAMCTAADNIAKDVAARAFDLARRSQVPHRVAAAAYCRGLLHNDPAILMAAADRYEEADRPLLHAKALEAAAIGFVHRSDMGPARAAFIRAHDLYDRLGASWDLRQLSAQLRRYGIRRGSRAKHRQSQVGWNSLTPTEIRVAGMVASGLPNRQIAEQLVLSTRTIDTHVSHILAKLGVRSRVDIAREATTHARTSGIPPTPARDP